MNDRKGFAQSIETSYMGMRLSGPVIASSSPLTASADSVAELAAAGAGAVVLKSVFEEQIAGQAASLEKYSDYPEAQQYLNRYMEGDYVNGYINLVKELKKRVNIPVIGSINCHTSGRWVEYAAALEDAGADAIELNIFLQPVSPEQSGAEIESAYLDIAAAVTESVTAIPVAVKLAPHFTNPLNVITSLRDRGVKGVVLFNRMFEPQIQIDTMQLTAGDPLSAPAELRASLRTVALCSAKVEGVDISVSTGVHDHADAIRSLLAGATTVQVCTALYKNGIGYISDINAGIADWMNGHGYRSIEDFRARMNAHAAKDGGMYYRTQYMRYFPE